MGKIEIDLTRYEREQDIQANQEKAVELETEIFINELNAFLKEWGFSVDDIEERIVDQNTALLKHHHSQTLFLDAVGDLIADYVDRESREWD